MRKVKIKHDLMYLKNGGNLKQNSIHNIIDPPEGFMSGVWVLGEDNTPVKLISCEFEFVK